MKNVFWNSSERRIRALWRLLIVVALFFVLQVILGAVAGLAFMSALVAAGGVDLTNPAAATQLLANMPAFVMVGGIISVLATVGSAWIGGRLLDRRPFADFGFHFSRGWWLDFAFGLGLGALLMTIVFVVERAAGWITVTGTLVTSEPGASFGLAILVPLVLFICVGIYEELISRGYLLLNAAEGLNFRQIGSRAAVVLAWVLSSSIFGLLHANNPNASLTSTGLLVAAGLFLGLPYILTGELAIPIGLHITWNFFQGNVYGFPVSGGNFRSATFIGIQQGGPDLWTGGAFGPEAGLMGLAMMLLGSLLVILWVRARQGRLHLRQDLAEYERQGAVPDQPRSAETPYA